MGLSWIRSCWLAWSARPLSSAQDLRCKAGLGTRPQPREPPSCRAQWEAGAWHGYGALQVSRSPSQPQQLDPGGEQDSPGSLLAAEPRGTCRAREKVFVAWPGGAAGGVLPAEGSTSSSLWDVFSSPPLWCSPLLPSLPFLSPASAPAAAKSQGRPAVQCHAAPPARQGGVRTSITSTLHPHTLPSGGTAFALHG